MALVRVYCGLASTQANGGRSADPARSWLTVAVVDDSGRLLDVCDVSDDPAGYVELGAILAERSGGFSGACVATDTDEYQVTLLLAAAGSAIAVADEDTVDDYAERFGDDESAEELAAPRSERRAIGLARALQAGALAATVVAAPRELQALKPVLAAHGALATGRHAAAVALREVLRELYPAALRAYPDPADPIPLAVLDALPEPGLLGTGQGGRGRDASVIAALAEAGVADAGRIGEAVTALRVAISETPRRTGIGKALTTAVAESIRQAVAAVRAFDASIAALVGLLAERATVPGPVPAPAPLRSRPEPAEPRRAARPAVVPVPVSPAAAVPPRVPPPAPLAPPAVVPVAASAAPAPVGPYPPAAPYPAPAGRPGGFPPAQYAPPGGHRSSEPAAPPVPAPVPAGRAAVSMPSVAQRFTPRSPAPGSRADWPLNSAAGTAPAPAAPDTRRAAPAAPTSPTAYPPAAIPATRLDLTVSGGFPPLDEPLREGRVPPPWLDEDLPSEPPVLRLVEPAPLADPALRDDPLGYDPPGYGPLREPAPLSDPLGFFDGERGFGSGYDLDGPLSRPTSGAAPVPVEADDDLLIFAQTRSAWFSDTADAVAEPPAWNSIADVGWQAAERAARPILGDDTSAGLPRRVPQANLVPGSALPPASPRGLRVVRDAAAMAAHTTGYFQGSRRGEEVRGFAVGGRPGREAPGGWDFARDGWEDGSDTGGFEYRSAARH